MTSSDDDVDAYLVSRLQSTQKKKKRIYNPFYPELKANTCTDVATCRCSRRYSRIATETKIKIKIL